MTESDSLLKGLQRAVSEHDDKTLTAMIDRGLEARVPVADMHRNVLLGLEEVRHDFMSNKTSLPDFLLCLDTTTEGLRRLSPLQDGRSVTDEGIPLVIGVVEGDPHDLGKNIIAAVYRAYGYRVFDLGCQVPNGRFVEAVLEHGAEVLALSAMMSTTAAAMRDIIRAVKARSPETAIMVGGAPVTEIAAKAYGADGYAESAVTVIEETKLTLEKAGKGTRVRP